MYGNIFAYEVVDLKIESVYLLYRVGAILVVIICILPLHRSYLQQQLRLKLALRGYRAVLTSRLDTVLSFLHTLCQCVHVCLAIFVAGWLYQHDGGAEKPKEARQQ